MPKRKSEDINEAAFRIVRESTSESTPTRKRRKNPAAVALGRKGGLKGGKARMAKLTSEQRSELGSMAAKKRWGKE